MLPAAFNATLVEIVAGWSPAGQISATCVCATVCWLVISWLVRQSKSQDEYSTGAKVSVDTSVGTVPFTWTQREQEAGSASGKERKSGGHGTEHVRLVVSNRLSSAEMRRRSQNFMTLMNMRRSLRFFSSDPVPDVVVQQCIAAAGTAPSGAHKQPWFFAVVRSAEKRAAIRDLVEREEKINYDRRMRKSWVDDVAGLTGTGADPRLHSNGAPVKPYLTEAPLLIVVFKQMHGVDKDGKRIDHYYVGESCGIATGMLLAALHNVGLATLTSTPMGAGRRIREILGRPSNEKVYLLLPIGFPAADATVPYRSSLELRKPLHRIMSLI